MTIKKDCDTECNTNQIGGKKGKIFGNAQKAGKNACYEQLVNISGGEEDETCVAVIVRTDGVTVTYIRASDGLTIDQTGLTITPVTDLSECCHVEFEPFEQIFDTPQLTQSFVPDGATTLSVYAYGGGGGFSGSIDNAYQGGNPYFPIGGDGGFVHATGFPVTAGDPIAIQVGGGGLRGANKPIGPDFPDVTNYAYGGFGGGGDGAYAGVTTGSSFGAGGGGLSGVFDGVGTGTPLIIAGGGGGGRGLSQTTQVYADNGSGGDGGGVGLDASNQYNTAYVVGGYAQFAKSGGNPNYPGQHGYPLYYPLPPYAGSSLQGGLGLDFGGGGGAGFIGGGGGYGSGADNTSSYGGGAGGNGFVDGTGTQVTFQNGGGGLGGTAVAEDGGDGKIKLVWS